MIYLTVHLYVQPGMEKEFHEYEKAALKVFRAYGGELVSAFRPEPDRNKNDCPDEIHMLRIPNMESFQDFKKDGNLEFYADIRMKIIRKTEVFVSADLIEY